MTIRRISITFVAILFSTISFRQVKSIDERIGEAMNGSNWAELRSLYMSDGKNLQTPFLKPLSKFFISQFYNEPDSAIKYGKETLEKLFIPLAPFIEKNNGLPDKHCGILIITS